MDLESVVLRSLFEDEGDERVWTLQLSVWPSASRQAPSGESQFRFDFCQS